MRLESGGIDVYYIDESTDREAFAMSAIAVPFLRQVEGTWTLVWDEHFKNIRDWRRRASKTLGIPVSKELKANKLASGRGRYKRGKDQFTQREGVRAFRSLLSDVSFLPNLSIITVIGTAASELYGHSRLEAVLYALLQRMRTACAKSARNGLVFFDEGHGEYRKLFRKAQAYLPTGSSLGSWETGKKSKNMPLDNFTKDGNTKDSRYSHFIQLADLVSYSAFIKAKAERGALSEWQSQLNLGTLYDSIPTKVLNTHASRFDPQGIVRL